MKLNYREGLVVYYDDNFRNNHGTRRAWSKKHYVGILADEVAILPEVDARRDVIIYIFLNTNKGVTDE